MIGLQIPKLSSNPQIFHHQIMRSLWHIFILAVWRATPIGLRLRNDQAIPSVR